jgi:site-specific DNA recombinase
VTGAELQEVVLAGPMRHPAAGLARYKCPEQLHLLDALPRNGMGKILKNDIRAALASSRALDDERAAREAARRFMAGETWSGLARYFTASGIPPVAAKKWTISAIRNMLMSPATAGIAIYNGSLRPEHQEGKPRAFTTNPEGIALKDAAGRYVMGNWKPVLTVDEWKALIAESDARQKGQVFSARGTRKYLLTGLLRCGHILEDGTVCNRSLQGVQTKYKSGNVAYVYRCPEKVNGGAAEHSGTWQSLTLS